ncbi:ABC transporter ATP-binding protein [Thiocapsa marina]|uniref:Teichoic-acid-transporting ATPase n=1 Tax=Thiocapsa marina 5811 TaxID=768671 RepID=F9U6Z2_9GAMM|nr:ABC transporter ATP-binding protein [Thiocapsa marina]EGV20018.1 Teichoic-acid-transporting ATPase [Thiocapsa marina 5811]
MNAPRIRLLNVDLHYACSAFKQRSLLAWIGERFRLGDNRTQVADIHALRNVSVDIGQGERVGLLGRNGAGKSTFLKAVAGLYPISGGNIEVHGELRALFNLGLGFEPDATGRENILYRGLLLGATPTAMRAKEDEIVAFAALGEYIDYPIKTYSAGMQVRLAFAISTTVGGDILLLDEVIGAGDATFMVRAKQRIFSLIEQSEILVLASHDVGSLSAMCARGIVLDGGRLLYDGPISSAIEEFKRVSELSGNR